MDGIDNLEKKDGKADGRRPKVSVLVPVYNVEKYVGMCLDSLLCQTLKDMEIICIDDGSTDNSSAILAEYAKRDSRIIIITKENTGYGASMNLGLSRAKGEYIGIVESDDYALPEMFEQLYIKAQENELEVVKTNYYEVFPGIGMQNFIGNLDGLPYEKTINPLEEMEIFYRAPSIWSGLYKRSFLEKNEILFHETPGASYQDISFAFFVMYFARRVMFLKEAYLCYRCDNEASSMKSRGKVFCVCEEMEWIEERIGKQDQRLQCFVQTLKFDKYIYNYNRIDSMYQYAFLLKMQNAFEEANQNGFLDRVYWDQSKWKIMEEIRMMPEHYFERSNKDYINRYHLSPYTLNHSIYVKGLLEEMNCYAKIVIYGAGTYGKKALDMLRGWIRVYAFAVTDKEGNPEEIDSIRVYKIDALLPWQNEVLVVVAVDIKKQTEIVKGLWDLGFRKIVTLDMEM